MNCGEIVGALKELKADTSATKNVRERINRIITFLQNDPELGKDKAIVEIEEMLEGDNIEPYLRTQIWNVVSMIEST